MFEIHKMRKEDIEEVAALEKAIFPDAWSAAALEESLMQKQTMMLTAFDDKKLIGYLILY